EREELGKNARPVMVTVSIAPRTIRILPRGNWLDDSGAVVEPAVPAFLPPLPSGGQARSSRLDLANWLTSQPDGVGLLTARVFANRWWYLCFGEGLARVMDDLGGQGQPPSHPELLDNLAVEFLESGWNVKHMLRLIVLSHTYRQSSLTPAQALESDPYNLLLTHQNRYRLPAELVRDAAMSISGLLVDEIGGASVKPYQPAGYYRHLNFPTRAYFHNRDERQWRRGVYVHWQRQFLHPMLRAFDAPTREECTAKRTQSNTPVAALTLLNDPSFVEAARVFAARILHEPGKTDSERIAEAWQLAVSRQPDDEEQQLLQRLLTDSRQLYSQDKEAAEKLVAIGQAPLEGDVDVAELAAWTMLARTLLNLNETITRN
ncbi:MAG: DUF1553 domain-containing protein, partial [Caldilineaceae bacterium]|nr:DUF1553 domain-containing protein [Caldilineaceae bacterium]